MHIDFDLNVEGISKTEGHASLEVRVRNGKVETVKLKVVENKRFFTQAVRGKDFKLLPQTVSRICGTCSIAHQLCSIEAIERALGIKPSHQTILLRKLLMYGLMIRDHALHLYFFSLPDIFGKDSILEFEGKEHKFLHDAFDVKYAGNSLSKLIGGRAVHPPFTQVGGFLKVPSKEEVEKVIKELKEVREKVLDLIEVFYRCDFEFRRKTNFVALCTPNYNFLEGEIRTADGLVIREEDYWDYLNRVVIPYSQATGFEFEGREYMVGALARMNLNRQALNEETKKDVSEYLKVFPSDNVYHNNLAQAIEILHSIDEAKRILEISEFKKEKLPEIKPKMSKGIGVVEAPRGTLYYMVQLDEQGRLKYANLVIPTAQNQIQMEKDIKRLISENLSKSKEEIRQEVEKLIRAYDPCFSCASHFLRIKWI